MKFCAVGTDKATPAPLVKPVDAIEGLFPVVVGPTILARSTVTIVWLNPKRKRPPKPKKSKFFSLFLTLNS